MTSRHDLFVVQDIPTHVDDPGREKATLEEVPVDSESDLSAESGEEPVASAFSKRKGSNASASSELSLPDVNAKQRIATGSTSHARAAKSGAAAANALWMQPPELPDELVRLTPFPIYSADALSAESRAPIGELPLFFYWFRRAVYPVKTTGIQFFLDLKAHLCEMYSNARSGVETDALYKLVLQLTGIDMRATSTEELLARAQKQDVSVSPIPWPEPEKGKKGSRPASGPSQTDGPRAQAADEEEKPEEDVIPRAEHERIVEELQQKLVDMQNQQQCVRISTAGLHLKSTVSSFDVHSKEL